MKKNIAIVLLVIGIIFICLSIFLTVIATVNKDIIGGVSYFPSALFVLRHEHNGLYFYLHICGIISLIASVIITLKAKNK